MQTEVQQLNTSQSRQLYERARLSIPGGVHSSSRFRRPHPLYFSRAEGAYIWDVDGNRYLDCNMGNGALILGHKHPAVVAAVSAALERGLQAGYETELSVRVAEKFLKLVRTAERVRFTNTGTEAALHALQIARALTGKDDVAKVEGCYDGWADPLFVSVWHDPAAGGPAHAPRSIPGTRGLARSQVERTLVIPFNDLEGARRLLEANSDRLAALILEPVLIDVGFVPADREYLLGLRALTQELGIVFIMDEVLTGFRLAVGGAQEHYGVVPDISIFGKAVANGHIMAVVAGTARALSVCEPGAGQVAFVGTFNGHQLSLAAADAVLDILADGAVVAALEERTRRLARTCRELAAKYGVDVQFQGGGGHFQWYFNPRPVRNYREAWASDPNAYAVFREAMLEAGVVVAGNYLGHNAISLAHGEEELEFLERAMAAALAAVARSGSPCSR